MDLPYEAQVADAPRTAPCVQLATNNKNTNNKK